MSDSAKSSPKLKLKKGAKRFSGRKVSSMGYVNVDDGFLCRLGTKFVGDKFEMLVTF